MWINTKSIMNLLLKTGITSIHEVIKKNSLPLFSHPTPKTKSKQAEQTTMLKHDVELFPAYILLWSI